MEAGFIILAIVTCIIGVLIGVRVERIRTRNTQTQGTIYAYYDDSDSDPLLGLEYNVSISDIAARKRVLFDVVVIDKNSHE
jgi:hypothetical protein